MADRSKIEWCDATWNPITGCTPISAGCRNCYASRMVKRFTHLHGLNPEHTINRQPLSFDRIRVHHDRLDQPLRWKKPRRIFVCSMGDLFHEDVLTSWLLEILGVIVSARQHTFMVLTKRPDRMKKIAEMAADHDFFGATPRNLWLGVTAENQEMADQRIPILLQTPAAKRFVSVEPMLGPVDLKITCIKCQHYNDAECPSSRSCCVMKPRLDWIICGGESGPGARPMHPDWARTLRNQCQTAGAPFFFKSFGQYGPNGSGRVAGCWTRTEYFPNYGSIDPAHINLFRCNPKWKDAQLLDGREWKEFPAPPPVNDREG